MRITKFVLVVAVSALVACNSVHPELAVDTASAIALTGGPNTSLIYVARTDSGVIAIDLGWWGHSGPFKQALSRLGATPSDVRAVFLTHSHRDHIGAWREVPAAVFHMSLAERSRFFGAEPHRGWMVRAAERIKTTDFPDSASTTVQPFASDTLFALGPDTLRAWIVPGHTAGSAAYLFRGILFIGDAATHRLVGGFATAKPQFTDDSRQARASLAALLRRLPSNSVRILCTAHAECAPFSAELRRRLGGDWPKKQTPLDSSGVH